MQCESTHEFRSWYAESDFIVTCEKEGNHRIHAAKVPGLAGSWYYWPKDNNNEEDF